MSNLTPAEILLEINKIRLDNNLPKDEKVKPLGVYELNDLPKIPSSWKWVLINDISEFITNGVHTPTSQKDEKGFGLRCLRITDLQDYNQIDYDSLPFCLRIVNGDYDKKLRKNDIYFSFTGNNLGKRYIVKEDRDDVVFAHYFVRWRPILVDPYYVFYVTHSKIYDIFINGHQLGSAQCNLKVTDLKRFPIPLCDLYTQKKISYVLKCIDDKIELNNKINDNLQGQIESIFKDWFIDFSPFGGEKPMFMKEVLLEKICEVVTKGTTPTTLKKSFTKTGINFIKAESILDNHSFDSTKFSFIDDETNSLLKRSIINENDILFTIAGTLGRFALVSNDILPANTNQAVAIIRHDKSKVDPYYLYSFFLGNWHNAYYAQRVQQAVQANLSLTTIKSLPILMMDTDNMKKYTSIISPLIKSILSVRNENNILIELRDTLLPKLMSGEIDVSNIKLDI